MKDSLADALRKITILQICLENIWLFHFMMLNSL